MNTSKRHVYGLITLLFFMGFGIFLYRHEVLNVPLTEDESVNSWTVEANLRFKAQPNMPVKASFTIPYMPPHYSILDEYFVSRNYGVTTNLVGYNRQAVWSLRRSKGSQSLYYRAIFHETTNQDVYLRKPGALKPVALSENTKTAVDTIIAEARQSSADIQTFTQSVIKALNEHNGNAKILVGHEFDDRNLVNAALMILNEAKINVLPIEGIYLRAQTHAEFKPMLAVYNQKEWIYINPRTGAVGLPKDFLIWQYNNEPMFDVLGGTKCQFSLTVSPTPINALSAAKARGTQTESQLIRFSLLQLPIDVQNAYKILLTVPVGAFIILILRNYIGLSTFGTFMPVLIALAFRETHVIWGLLLFTLIVSFGLLARFYLDQLRLLLVPRLASILTVVILLMIFISIMMQSLGLGSGLSVALFPMVILTMTIERMCVTWDERGPSEAIKSGSGSMLAAVITYWVINYPPLEYLLFAFPELLLVVLALILSFGQYRGFRLTELLRFRSLGGKNVIS
jgi:hypothetical protein